MSRLFDGNGDYISFTNVPPAVGDLTAFSVSFSLIRDAMAGYRDVVWLGGSYGTNHNFLVQHDTSGYMVVAVGWNSNVGRWSITNPDANWHNHVITYASVDTSSDPLWYQDGVSQTVTERSTPSGSRIATTTDEIIVGAQFGAAGEYWLGKIAELGIWNRVLTSDEADIIGKGASPLTLRGGLVFYSPILGRFGPEPDLISNSVGAVTNAVPFGHPKISYPFKPNSTYTRKNINMKRAIPWV